MNESPSVSDFVEVMGRIQLISECRTQTELADFLGLRQSSISDAKKRGSIPSDWLLTLWRKKGGNPERILTGQGSQKLHPAECLEQYETEELLAEIASRIRKNCSTGAELE